MDHKELVSISANPTTFANKLSKELNWEIEEINFEDDQCDAGVTFKNNISIQIATYSPEPFGVHEWSPDETVFYDHGMYESPQALIKFLKTMERKYINERMV